MEKYTGVIDLDAQLKLAGSVRHGTLDSGIEYYVAHNRKPKKRASMYIVVKAGSYLEDEHESGIAHMIEHLAFRATKNFDKFGALEYFQSKGIAFGPHSNAYTSFHETVYNLHAPIDEPALFKKLLCVMREMVLTIRISDEDVESERTIVMEEYRNGLNCDTRREDHYWKTLYGNSRHVTRFPIGTADVIQNAKPQVLRDFYQRWYHPKRMCVIVVGDLQLDKIEQTVSNVFCNNGLDEAHGGPHWSRDKEPPALVPMDKFVPSGSQTAVYTDREMTEHDLSVSFLYPNVPTLRFRDVRQEIVENLFQSAMNERLLRIALLPNRPWDVNSFYYDSLALSLGVKKFTLSLFSTTFMNSSINALKCFCEEILRLQAFGFSKRELEYVRKEYKSDLESRYVTRKQLESMDISDCLVGHYMGRATYLDVADEVSLCLRLLDEVEDHEISNLSLGLKFDESVRYIVSQHSSLVTLLGKRVLESAFKSIIESVSIRQKAILSDCPSSSPKLLLPKRWEETAAGKPPKVTELLEPDHESSEGIVGRRMWKFPVNEDGVEKESDVGSDKCHTTTDTDLSLDSMTTAIAKGDVNTNASNKSYCDTSHSNENKCNANTNTITDCQELIKNGASCGVLNNNEESDDECESDSSVCGSTSTDDVDDTVLYSTKQHNVKVCEFPKGNDISVPEYETLEEVSLVHEIMLKNGMKVLMKRTTLNDDEVEFIGTAVGGRNEFPNDMYLESMYACNLADNVGKFGMPSPDFSLMMAGVRSSVSVDIDEFYRTVEMSCSPLHLEKALHSLYQLFVSEFDCSRQDFLTWQQMLTTWAENELRCPSTPFRRKLNHELYGDHRSFRLPLPEDFDNFDFKLASEIFTESFRDPEQFTFVVVGNFSFLEMEKLCVKYLGSIPKIESSSSRSSRLGRILQQSCLSRIGRLKDNTVFARNNFLPVTLPKLTDRRIEHVVVQAVEPCCETCIAFPFKSLQPLYLDLKVDPKLPEYSCSLLQDADKLAYLCGRHCLNVVIPMLKMRLEKVLRFQRSSIYSVSAYVERESAPNEKTDGSVLLWISFSCSPELVDELTLCCVEVVENFVPTQHELESSLATMRRSYEDNLLENCTWSSLMQFSYLSEEYNGDPVLVLQRYCLAQLLVVKHITVDIASSYFHNSLMKNQEEATKLVPFTAVSLIPVPLAPWKRLSKAVAIRVGLLAAASFAAMVVLRKR